MSASSSSLISISPHSNSSSSSLTNFKSLHFQNPLLSFSKTPNFSLILKTPKFFNFYKQIQAYETLEPESLPIEEEELQNDDVYDDDDDYDEEEEEEIEPESPEAGRLYIGNLPYSITSAELSQIFGEAGVVNSVEVIN